MVSPLEHSADLLPLYERPAKSKTLPKGGIHLLSFDTEQVDTRLGFVLFPRKVRFANLIFPNDLIGIVVNLSNADVQIAA